MSRELPALDKVMPGGVEFCGLKGYDHYPCLRKAVSFAMAREGALDGVREAGHEATLSAVATILACVSQAPEADLDGLGIRWKNVPRSKLTTTPHECQRTRCPFYPEECLLHGARRRAACADVVVTNHSLLRLDVQAGGRILPPIRHWVVDEAHGLEAEARRQWAVEVSGEDARAGFERLGGSKTGVIHSLMVHASGMEGSTTVVGLLTKLAAASARAQVACADLFESVHELVGVAGGPGGYDSVNLWLDESVRSTPEWGAVSEAGVRSADLFAEASKCAHEAVQVLGESSAQMAADLSAATAFLDGIAEAISLIVAGEDDTYVFSAQLSRQRRRIAHEKLVAEKIDIGAEVAQKWLPETRSICLTSATMAVGEDFSHFSHSVGLDRLEPGSYRTLRLDSSYDFDGSMGVALTPDLPDPNSSDYLTALEDLLFDVHVAMDGSVLTLFTNRREMEQVYAGLAPRLSERGLDLMMQERSSSARQIRERFLAEKSLSLLALRSFWEGFDAGGDTLRCVVIPNLPFASPRDPLVRERDRWEERAWWRYSLPEAVLSVKQAAGRLIRTATDTGVLVIADSRLFTKRYGRAFVNSLPSRSCVKVPSEEIAEHIRNWRRLHELEAFVEGLLNG
ncbi:MAG: DNA polymerase III subunit epsilon, partial [Atopobiaceae bacterium]|nr:DNA polymerase III subunit epsilon [Atopobiaceae bacterium]